MWFKEYADYPIDHSLIKEKVEPGRGIIGCEMHDLNGWGTTWHYNKPSKKGLWRQLISIFFKSGRNKDKDNHEPS